MAGDPGGAAELGVRLRAAMSLPPPVLGGAPTQPLEVGRATRVVQSAQRTALAVRDGGCVLPDCSRPLAGVRPITDDIPPPPDLGGDAPRRRGQRP